MANHLIIVESPSKARTLGKFLGSSYTIKASMGHVRDLPKSKIGVDVDADFLPTYEVIKGKEKQIKELVAAAKKADSIMLAADPDREGEAIAWHLKEALKLQDPDRIVFHEITKGAVEAALTSPRKIDRDLVAAQEARRVIDRLVGYRLSPLLWRKVRKGLSAGRVQSVAVRLVVDREREIEAFQTKESWTVDALLAKEDAPVKARLLGRIGDEGSKRARSAKAGEEAEAKFELPDEAAARVVADALGFDDKGAPTKATPPFRVAGVETSDSQRSAPLPYTTSSLQQDASTRLRFSPKRTMSLAQELYEGADLGSAGSTGLITYMRTDSTRVSPGAQSDAATFVTGTFGDEFVRKGAPRKSSSKAPQGSIQDAHEAIRPTDVSRTPESIQAYLGPAQYKLYDLIWRRFVASHMSNVRFENTRAYVHAGDYRFRASGSVLRFEGFTKVWRRDDKDDESRLPALAEGDVLDCRGLNREQHFTQPPPRFTEASLIKELEERGIGRPSTYAPTIEVVQERNYVRQEERKLHPTELGKTVDGVLREHFPQIVDVSFTAELEARLDGIGNGSLPYVATVREWYAPFAATVEHAETSMERVRVPSKPTGEACPECGEGELVVREGRFGEFTGCSRYPECAYIKGKGQSEVQAVGEDCPECGKPLVVRQGRRGAFVACSGYPSCKYIKGDVAVVAAGEAGADGVQVKVEDLGVCPDCGKPLGRKSGRRGPFIGCTGYPGCKYIQPRSGGAAAGGDGSAKPAGPAPEPTGEKCPECDSPLVKREGRYGPFVSCSGYPKCKYRPPRTGAAAAASTR